MSTITASLPNNFSIVRLSSEHLAAVAEVERLCFSTPWSEDSLRMLTEDPNVGFVVSCDETVVGYCGMQCVCDEGQITDIAVIPAYRRRGLAAALLSVLISEAKARGITVMFLEVRESNLPALSLYRDRFGFEEIGVRRNFYSHPKENALNMRLMLSAGNI